MQGAGSAAGWVLSRTADRPRFFEGLTERAPPAADPSLNPPLDPRALNQYNSSTN